MDACEAGAVFGVFVLSLLGIVVSTFGLVAVAVGVGGSAAPWSVGLLVALAVSLLSRERMRALGQAAHSVGG